jgi:hypothetical protein
MLNVLDEFTHECLAIRVALAQSNRCHRRSVRPVHPAGRSRSPRPGDAWFRLLAKTIGTVEVRWREALKDGLVGMLDSATRQKEEKMKMLPQVLFWLGLISVPFAWLVWYFGSEIEIIRPVLARINDPALRAALQEAHAERLGIWVAVWPVSFLVLSQILEKKMQG